MPIRINLLAEAQAAEEVRRKDPVKRSIYVAVCLVVMVLVWISSLEVKIMADKSRLGNLESRLATHTNAYYQILDSKRRLADVDDKLAALNRLAANRFLQSAMLDTLMHSTVDGIQITRLRLEQGFEGVSEVKQVKEGGRIIVPARAASATERIKLTLDAKDSSPNPGDERINKFKETLAHSLYFQAQQISTNNILLKNLSPPQPDDTGKPYVNFTLECTYPDKVRGL